MTDFADIKRQARQDIHAAFAVPALYSDPDTPAVELHVRWHDIRFRETRLDVVGNIGDYAEVLASVDKVVFDSTELAAKGVMPVRGGELTFPDYNDYQLHLDAKEPTSGPVKVTWYVVRPKQSIEP